MSEQKVMVHGHYVAHEPDVDAGIHYLMFGISAQEAKVFFDEAYRFGFAMFEDRLRHKYKLIKHGLEYELVKQ